MSQKNTTPRFPWPEDLVCPACGEKGFDAFGLTLHFGKWGCPADEQQEKQERACREAEEKERPANDK